MPDPVRMHRVRSFCDWLDTIPPQPPFHQHPGFRFYADLTQAEMNAAQAEMRRRAAASNAEADELEIEAGTFREFERVCWQAVAWLKAARDDQSRQGQRIALSEDTADVLLLFIDHLAALTTVTRPPSGSEAA